MNDTPTTSETRPMPPRASGPTGLAAVLESMRLSHWIKNAFVLAPILFAHDDAGRPMWQSLFAWAIVGGAALAFGLLSSAVYLINDVADRRSDRAHPIKSRRPVASGRLAVSSAILWAAVLVIVGAAACYETMRLNFSAAQPLRGLGLVVWTGAYLVLNLLYTFWLKHWPIVDVLVVALGFVLRAMAGAAALAVPISSWLVVCTFTLCLFIALTKRRSEILDAPPDRPAAARRVNAFYDAHGVEYMVTVATAMAILTYSLYCLAPRTIRLVGSAHMVWTIPLVIYGMFRYNLITRRAGQSDPVSVLVRDKAMWAVVALYVLLGALVVKFGAHAAVRAVLDVDGIGK